MALRFARSLLASTSLTFTEAGNAAGFNDISHFGRAFRRRYVSVGGRGSR
jgi:AraC-like DNA-binding protein